MVLEITGETRADSRNSPLGEVTDDCVREGEGLGMNLPASPKRMEIDCSEIRIGAERRVGQMIASQKEAGLMAKPPGKKIGSNWDPISDEPVALPPQTLAELGIDKLEVRVHFRPAPPPRTSDVRAVFGYRVIDSTT